MYNYTRLALKALDRNYKVSDNGSDWITAFPDTIKQQVILHDRSVRENLVPNVIGMGARDAIYLLENEGLKVVVRGSGKVTEQSLEPGTQLVKGSVISISLK